MGMLYTCFLQSPACSAHPAARYHYDTEAIGTELPHDFFEGDFRLCISSVLSDPETDLKDAYAKLASIWN